MGDRDRRGVLWDRATLNQGHGRPQYARIHPLRQRRAMLRLLCQVCGGPADATGEGVLWVVRGQARTWPDWPNGMVVSEPPICAGCLDLSVRLCPTLREGYDAIRAGGFLLRGVDGFRYRVEGRALATVDREIVAFTNPLLSWTLASKLVRCLTDCTVLQSWAPRRGERP